MVDEPYVELTCCESVIEQELANPKCKQKNIAMTYAMAIRSTWPTNWTRVNNLIAAKWGTRGLVRVKNTAWRLIEQKKAEAPQ